MGFLLTTISDCAYYWGFAFLNFCVAYLSGILVFFLFKFLSTVINSEGESIEIISTS